MLLSLQLFANESTPQKPTELNIKLALISAMSETVHSLQQERGASCGYISSDGKKFGKKLASITQNSDAKIDAMHTFINTNQTVLSTSISEKDHTVMNQTFEGLYVVRKSVKALKMDFAKTYSKYTQSIAFMLMNISNLVDSFENKALSDKLYSYSIILMYKESIGQKRAALSALFSQEVFSKEIFEYFLTSNTTESIYLKSFLHSVDDETKETYLNAFKDEAIKEVDRYESLALEKLSGKDVAADPRLWFEYVTTKIDLVQSVERKVFADALLIATEVNNASLLVLTQEEKSWIETHVVKVGVEQWMPVVFSNNGKDIDGIGGDFIKKITEKTGLKVEIVNEKWSKLLKDFEDQKLDLLPTTYYTEKRAKFGLYSDGYFKMKDAIYVKETNHKVRSLKDLDGDTLAIPKGYGTIDKLRQHFPKIKLVLTKDLDDSINRVLNGRVTAFYEGQIAAEAKIDDELIKGIKGVSVKAFAAPSLHFFSKIDEPLLGSILQKGLKSISYQEKNEIISKWGNIKQAITLTPIEQRWIERNEPIAYSYDPDYAPFEWTNEVGLHSGIIADILKIVSSKTDITFVPIPAATWTEAVELAKSGEVEMLSAASKNSEREKYMNFTSKSIYSNLTLLLAHTDDKSVYLDMLGGMSNKKIGVIKGTALAAYLSDTYPQLSYVPFSSTKEGFESVRNKTVDLFAINAATAQYFIKQRGYEDLRVALKLDYIFDLKIALSKEMPPEVISILEKALESISPKEIADIYYKWTNVSVETKIDWVMIAEISGVILLILLFVLYNNYKLKSKVIEKTADINRQKDELENLISSFDKNVIFSKTDLNGKIIQVSEAFCEISGYTEKELLGKPHSIVRHVDMPEEAFKEIWVALKKQSCIQAEVKNLKKDGSYYWVDVKFEPEYDIDGKHIGYSALRVDITAKKEVEELSEGLEIKIEERTKELNAERTFISTVMNSQDNFVITSDGRCLKSVNKAFLEFYGVKDIDAFQKKYGECICDTFNTDASEEYIQKFMGDEKWLEYVYNRPHQVHKISIIQDDVEHIFTVTTSKIIVNDEEMKVAVFSDVTDLESAKKEVEEIHQHTRESIEYASMIQGALIPANKALSDYFQDHFAIWQPKDTIGGDIYLFEELRNSDECLLMVIDCTGHGVPGAFVTMLVKAIERQIVAKIKNSDEVVSPANLLGVFNRSMKHLLKQETKESISNVGFDGGIIYYNKKEKLLRFAGAGTPLFYVEDGELNVIKGSRYSVGYKKCEMDYEYKEYSIDVKDGMEFYLTTDGFLDQNGGSKGFPFGKKRFENIIKEHRQESMVEQEAIFLDALAAYEGDEERNDDVTLVGFTI